MSPLNDVCIAIVDIRHDNRTTDYKEGCLCDVRRGGHCALCTWHSAYLQQPDKIRPAGKLYRIVFIANTRC